MKGNIMSEYKTQGQEDCADCEWMAEETDGQILICNECALEQNLAELRAINAREEFKARAGIFYMNDPDSE